MVIYLFIFHHQGDEGYPGDIGPPGFSQQGYNGTDGPKGFRGEKGEKVSPSQIST